MGAPLEDAPRLHDWSNWIQRQFDAPSLMNDRARIEQAVSEFYEWCEGMLAARRGDPRDDLVSTLLAAEQEGDRLSEVECMHLVLNVLVGGVDTTQSQLAHAVRLFASRPDQWRLLAERPELAPQAVEEVLRYEPITPFTARIMVEDVEYRDVTFPEGTVVMVCAFTANRDGEGNLHELDITADRSGAKPVTFGAGVHYCLGANIARAELQEALAFLPARMQGLELDGEPELGSINGIYGLDHLPIRWDAADARRALHVRHRVLDRPGPAGAPGRGARVRLALLPRAHPHPGQPRDALPGRRRAAARVQPHARPVRGARRGGLRDRAHRARHRDRAC